MNFHRMTNGLVATANWTISKNVEKSSFFHKTRSILFCHRMKSYLHCTKKTRSCVAKLVYYSIEAVGCTMVCNQNPKTMVGCSIQNLQTTYYVVVDGHLRVPLRWLSVLFAFAPLRVSPFLFVVSKSNKPKKHESD